MDFLRIQKTFKNELPTIFLLPTPIGNMNDITKNIIDYFMEIDILYCEDTRTTKNLLNHFGIKNKITKSFHKYNEGEKIDQLVDDLLKNKKIGICSDAGMPGICDPGMAILNKIIKNNNNINVTVVSPNCAFLGSLLVSGLYYNDFTFVGFLSKKENQINKLIEENSNKGCLVFYESVHRIQKTISTLNEILDDTTLISIIRELTKINEEVITGKIGDVLNYIMSDEFILKGEFCIVIENNYLTKKNKIDLSDNEIISSIKDIIDEGNKLKDAVKIISEKYNLNKNSIYNLYISKKGE